MAYKPSSPFWRIGPGRVLPLDRPRVMAILNVTPDSFSDGGRYTDPGRAVKAACAFVRDGADMIDIGGESTRPGAGAVSESEQLRRVLPVIGAIRSAGVDVPISIDTTRSAVAAAALDAGADVINDVSGGTDDAGMLALAAERGCGLVLMHRLVAPACDRYSDQYDRAPEYGDVVESVRADLAGKARRAVGAGCEPVSVVLDPGLGFGKSVSQNIALVRGGGRLVSLGYPLLGAASRKSFVGRLAMGPGDADPVPVSGRLGGSIAFTLMQLSTGVRLFRVHDVAEQARALRVAWSLWGGGGWKECVAVPVSRGRVGS